MRFAAALLLLAACATGTPRELTPPSNAALAEELAAMVQEDQDVRQRWLEDRQSEALRSEARQLARTHVARLDEIVAAHGWPGISLVGFNGMNHAWTLAQHGGADYLARVLPLMYEAVRTRELDESLYATSLDRVLTQQGKKQLYGTQFDTADGKCEPLPIEDPANVDRRRARAKMPPLADYTKELCAMYAPK